MKKITFTLVKTYSNIASFLTTRKHFSTPNSGIILMSLILASFIFSSLGFDFLGMLAFRIAFIFLFCYFLLFWLDADCPIIKLKTKKSCTTPREVFKSMTHFSFIYGLFFFSVQILILIECIALLMFNTFLGANFLVNFRNSWLFIVFLFSFMYFCYHIYINPNNFSLEEIQQRIDFYAAIGSTIGFVMLIVPEILDFKIFFSELAVVFTWLKHLINAEKIEKKREPK